MRKAWSQGRIFPNLDASAKLAGLLAPLDGVDKLDGARVSEQVKSQTSGKPLLHGIKVMPSGLFPSSRHAPTGSRTAGTPPDTKAKRIISLTAACHGVWPPLCLHDKPCVLKTLTFVPQTQVCSTTMGTPRRKPRASVTPTNYLNLTLKTLFEVMFSPLDQLMLGINFQMR